MIVGIGIDLVEVARIAELAQRHGRRLERLFTAQEVAYCQGRGRPAEAFAARFAAKEAFFKALGTGWGAGGDWTEVEVLRSEAGAPALRLSGRAAAAAAERGVARVHLSLTHTDETAAAMVVLEAAHGG